MQLSEIQVKTAEAAQIAGVGYEGFRSWLKRGLLKSTGLLPKLYAPDAEAEIADAKRWQWASFGFADLCAFRLAKLLLDAGFEWNVVNGIGDDRKLWEDQYHAQVRDEVASKDDVRNIDSEPYFLSVFGRGSQWTLYRPDQLLAELQSDTIKREWMTIIDLRELRRDVVARINKLASNQYH